METNKKTVDAKVQSPLSVPEVAIAVPVQKAENVATVDVSFMESATPNPGLWEKDDPTAVLNCPDNLVPRWVDPKKMNDRRAKGYVPVPASSGIRTAAGMETNGAITLGDGNPLILATCPKDTYDKRQDKKHALSRKLLEDIKKAKNQPVPLQVVDMNKNNTPEMSQDEFKQRYGGKQ